MPKKKLLTEAEAKERDERLKAAGIKLENPAPGTATITLLKRKRDLLEDDDGSGAVE